jgi:hypothetical protein
MKRKHFSSFQSFVSNNFFFLSISKFSRPFQQGNGIRETERERERDLERMRKERVSKRKKEVRKRK